MILTIYKTAAHPWMRDDRQTVTAGGQTCPMTVATVSDLLGLIERGGPVEFLFFYGHRAEPDGRPGRGCLSQWWPSAFTVDGLRFATAEHYMMWRKAMLFADEQAAGQILAAPDPAGAKALGRKVRGFDKAAWEAHRFEFVAAGSVAKFGQHPDLREFLLATGERVLVEASPRDRVWGIGLSAGHERAADPRQWRGLNLLGFALMRARAALCDA
jgi:ribA/ribD-fused uncharacterized protein